jgi:hypothetical protein
MKTTVVKIGHGAYDVYIGRKGKGEDGYFGNPHPIGWCDICKREHDRDDCIKAFSVAFYKRVREDAVYRRHVLELKGKTLGCFCHPLPCHGNIIANWVNRQ